MNGFKVQEDVKPLSELSANAPALLEQVHQTGRPLVITQDGRSAAVILAAAAYDALMEKMELLEEINLAEEEFRAGQGMENEEARKLALAALKQ